MAPMADGDAKTPCRRAVAGVGLCAASFLLPGLVFGVQGAYSELARRGFFSNRCAPDEPVPCAAQRSLLAQIIAAVLSIGAVSGVVNGIALDVFGAYRFTAACVVGYFIAVGMCGIDHSSGIMWAAGMMLAAVAVSGSILAITTRYIAAVSSNERGIAVWSGVTTACRGFAPLCSNALSALLAVRALTPAAVYALYSGVLGVPLALLFVVGMRGMLPERPGASITGSLRTVGMAATVMFKVPVYWVIVANLFTVIGFPAFYIATLGAFLRWRGVPSEELKHKREVFNILLAVGGVFPLFVSVLVARCSPRTSRRVVCCVQAALACTIGLGSLFLHGDYLWVPLSAFVAWRNIGFALVNVTYMAEFSRYGPAIGAAFGLAYTIGGVTSLALGSVFTSAVHSDSGAFTWVLALFVGLTVVLPLLLLVVPSAPQPNEAVSSKLVSMITIHQESSLLGGGATQHDDDLDGYFYDEDDDEDDEPAAAVGAPDQQPGYGATSVNAAGYDAPAPPPLQPLPPAAMAASAPTGTSLVASSPPRGARTGGAAASPVASPAGVGSHRSFQRFPQSLSPMSGPVRPTAPRRLLSTLSRRSTTLDASFAVGSMPQGGALSNRSFSESLVGMM